VDVVEGEAFQKCGHCDSALYIDKKKVVFHFVVTRSFDQQGAEGQLRRWMAGNQAVRGLDRNATIASAEFKYFPLWWFKTQNSAKAEVVHLRPAASTAFKEIEDVEIPAGSLKAFNPQEFDATEFVLPEVFYDAALKWLGDEQQVTPDAIRDSYLVHVPLWRFEYAYSGKTYVAIVDGSTGKVMCNEWPMKAEAPFTLVAVISLIWFALLAMFDTTILNAVGLTAAWAPFALMAVSAVPPVLGAYWVAENV
jgi:hypothetical protein